jgi:NlpE N-terminal domain
MCAVSSRPLHTHRPLSDRLLAMCWFFAAACATMLGGGRVADLSGTYQGHAPAADAARRVFTLELVQDGTAILDTLYIGKEDATQHGRWTLSGSQVVLTFDAMGPNRPSHPITFRHRDHALSPIHWDPSEWGRSGPPVLHRSRSKTISSGNLPDLSIALPRPSCAGL